MLGVDWLVSDSLKKTVHHHYHHHHHHHHCCCWYTGHEYCIFLFLAHHFLTVGIFFLCVCVRSICLNIRELVSMCVSLMNFVCYINTKHTQKERKKATDNQFRHFDMVSVCICECQYIRIENPLELMRMLG